MERLSIEEHHHEGAIHTHIEHSVTMVEEETKTYEHEEEETTTPEADIESAGVTPPAQNGE